MAPPKSSVPAARAPKRKTEQLTVEQKHGIRLRRSALNSEEFTRDYLPLSARGRREVDALFEQGKWREARARAATLGLERRERERTRRYENERQRTAAHIAGELTNSGRYVNPATIAANVATMTRARMAAVRKMSADEIRGHASGGAHQVHPVTREMHNDLWYK